MKKALEIKRILGGDFTNKELFADTDIDLLMRKMKYPDNIEIHKGYFPETAIEITDRFCFVNLDMDLYFPMYNALSFFGDKMVSDGIILLHDYFHSELPGVKRAVQDYEIERGVEINKITIGDGCSIALLFNTAVCTKIKVFQVCINTNI